MWGIIIAAVAIVLATLGWWGLYELTGSHAPEQPGMLPLFFALLFLALAGTLTPIVAYLHRRFAPDVYSRQPWRGVRQSVWVSLCLTSWAWLQMQREFHFTYAIIIVLIFVGIELFIVRLGSST